MKKQYSNLHDDGTPRTPTKTKRTKKPKKVKVPLDYTVPTFEPLIPRIEGVGFIYEIIITTGHLKRYYVGSKSFTRGVNWRTYCSSCDDVQKLIHASRIFPEACQVEFIVLEQVKMSTLLKTREEYYMRAMYTRVGKDACLNTATPLGYSLRTGKKLSR